MRNRKTLEQYAIERTRKNDFGGDREWVLLATILEVLLDIRDILQIHEWSFLKTE